MEAIENDQRLKKIEKEYLEFLDDAEDQGIYSTLIKNMIEEKRYRLIVNMNDLRRKNPTRAAGLLNDSFDEIVPFKRALKQMVESFDTEYGKGNTEFFIGFEGSFGSKHTTPRTLTSRFLGNMVCVEGIVVRCSLVRPKVVRSVHYCKATSTVSERAYSDLTSFDAFPATAVYPTQDDDGNPLETEYGLSTYKDHQTLTIQEMPEKAPAGQLPRSVEIILDDDLVDLCKPGDRVQVVGNYRCLPGKKGGYTSGAFRTVLIANSVTQLTKEATLHISHDDVTLCKSLSKKNPLNNIFELLAKSLAPSIHGHEYIKKAILCLLLGGCEKILSNGTRLRGDINILLIGDPSVAKSQLLRYVLNIAPRAITTTGRGSSGVGLTAAVTADSETGERRLEAGAMVLADRGVICIDEFDKMSDIDRTAIHEVMEQGRVTIAKAGIHASLNARCSVLAAANPVYGRYDQYKSPMENIGLQDSLLSRFDLLFVVLDNIDSDIDHIISDHVVRMHRYRNPNEQEGEALPFNVGLDYLSTKNPDSEEQQEEETQIYETYDPLLHGKSRKKTDKILSSQFMRKYIHIARIMKPELTEEARKTIIEEYSRLRSEDNVESDVARTQPITARSLETLIRLSTAHAKARLSKHVTVDDAQAAIELVQYAYFKRVLEKDKKRRRRAEDSDNEDDYFESQERTKRTRTTSESQQETVTETESTEVDQNTEEMETEPTVSEPTQESEPVVSAVTQTVEISNDRYVEFKRLLDPIFHERRGEDSMSISDIYTSINKKSTDRFSKEEIDSALQKMSEENKIMISDDHVFLI
ncbi:DNA replication licensing factor Mcm3 [Trichogramma pretiosum]|uniref:DNA replication licensing factor Mcm3 n=1 Tax=Trichogramma pretiosum TaxID=7493 RepID=UPI000C718EB9|nr:DNA replication licensing factor Mcm3 [Trichogramma pretiosum]